MSGVQQQAVRSSQHRCGAQQKRRREGSPGGDLEPRLTLRNATLQGAVRGMLYRMETAVFNIECYAFSHMIDTVPLTQPHTADRHSPPNTSPHS